MATKKRKICKRGRTKSGRCRKKTGPKKHKSKKKSRKRSKKLSRKRKSKKRSRKRKSKKRSKKRRYKMYTSSIRARGRGIRGTRGRGITFKRTSRNQPGANIRRQLYSRQSAPSLRRDRTFTVKEFLEEKNISLTPKQMQELGKDMSLTFSQMWTPSGEEPIRTTHTKPEDVLVVRRDGTTFIRYNVPVKAYLNTESNRRLMEQAFQDVVPLN